MAHRLTEKPGALLATLALSCALAAAAPASAGETPEGPYAGLTLAAALAELRSQGLVILFSSALVRPEMTVETEPAGSTPREVLAALLAPHGLAVHDGPDGSFLVVPGKPPPRAIRDAARDRNTPAAVEGIEFLDEIEVVPQLEVGSIHGGTLLRRAELVRIPTPRDPWAVVTHTPGILADRINVGGSESGVQALFLAPASSSEENVFEMDGVNTTDMAVPGASALYYDFDQFEELKVSTGGADVKTATAGVAVRMVTKRGSDATRGSGRLLATDADGIFGLFQQGSSDLSGDLAPGQTEAPRGNEIDRIADYGVELGGPLRRGRLWGWGSYGVQEIDLFTVGGFSDDTILENAALKLNAQPGASNSLVVSAHRGDKRKDNRGAGPGRAVETTWRQRGPAHVYRLEDTHVWTSSFFASAEYNAVDGGFSLIPRAGAGAAGGETLLDDDGVWKNGFFGGSSDRDSETFEAEGSLFFDVRGRRHTLDFGGSSRSYRYAEEFGLTGPRQAMSIACENVGTCGDEAGGDLIWFERRGRVRVAAGYTALWLRDTVTAGRWTWAAGLRFDLQDGRNLPGRAAPNPARPEELPGVAFAGDRGAFDWATLAPRLAASYAVDEAGKTLLRLSLGRFAEQLGAADVARLNPLESAYLGYSFRDLNGDNVWQEGEPLTFLTSDGFDPAAPFESSNRTDSGLDPELTDEVLLGVEQAFSPQWVAGLNLTWRRITGVAELRRLVRDGAAVRAATAEDYFLETTATVELPDGRVGTAAFYALDPALTSTGGELLSNGGRARRYAGLTLSFNRRPSDRWTMRGYLSFGEATWRVPASFFRVNDPTDFAGLGDNHADLFAAQGRGRRDDVFLQATWSAQWSGFYRIAPERRWGFTVAASFFARQGYPIPYLARFVSPTDGIDREGQVTGRLDDFRSDDVVTLDLSLEKELRLRGRLGATMSLAAFNVLNDNFVLQRERNLAGARPNHLEETLAPRVVRLGVRLHW